MSNFSQLITTPGLVSKAWEEQPVRLLSSYEVSVRDLKASLAELPVLAETPTQGLLVDLVKSMDKAYKKGNINIQVLPFRRSIRDVVQGRADFHLPILKNPDVSKNSLPYIHSTVTIFHVIFALYTHRDHPVELDDLGKPDIWIETDSAHTELFTFPIHPSPSLENSLRKLEVRRIDGFIFAAKESDALIQRLKLKNVESRLYKKFEVKIALARGNKSILIDSVLTKIFQAIHNSGDYRRIMGNLNRFYETWTPTKTDF